MHTTNTLRKYINILFESEENNYINNEKELINTIKILSENKFNYTIEYSNFISDVLGFDLIGQGETRTVYSKPELNFVIKTGDRENRKEIRHILKYNSINLPKLYAYDEDKGYWMIIEKVQLFKKYDEEFDYTYFDTNIFLQIFPTINQIINLLDELIQKGILDEKIYDNYIENYYPSLNEKCYLSYDIIQKVIDEYNIPLFDSFLDYCKDYLINADDNEINNIKIKINNIHTHDIDYLKNLLNKTNIIDIHIDNIGYRKNEENIYNIKDLIILDTAGIEHSNY
jgi:hypothetical protein